MNVSENIIEEWLVVNCQKGNRKALELLIKRWHPKMLRRVYHTTKDVAASQDIVQDAWVIIIKKIKTLRDPGAFEMWSLKIATTKAIDWIRANQLSRKRDEVRKMVQEDFSDNAHVSEEAILSLRYAIRQLKPEQRIVINMFYLENLTVLKISRILDLPIGTIKSRLFKAREYLRKILKTITLES